MHHDPEEIIELVSFSVVVDVWRGLIKNRSSVTDPIFCLGCSHSRGAELLQGEGWKFTQVQNPSEQIPDEKVHQES